MPQSVVIDTVGGPSDLDLFIHGLRDGQELEFTLDLPPGKQKCSTVINGLRDANGQRETWAMEGKIEISPGNWVEFENALYSPKVRKGHFGLRRFIEEMEQHPICLHLVPKGMRRCPVCNADRMDVG